jgi:nucleoside-diphosphate-sugar epimerase
MRIGITGVAGFIGSHLADALIQEGHSVIGVDNLAMGYMRNIQHHIGCPSFQFHEIDVRSAQQLAVAFKSVDVMVHLAAFKIPRYGNTIETLDVNTLGTRHILELARDGKRRAVFASTSDIYGKNPEVPFSENSNSLLGPTTVPRWSYAVSKLFDEHLAIAYNQSYAVPVSILRFFGSYGPRQHLTWWGGPQSVFIGAALRDEPIEIHGDGQQTRSFTYISDLVDGIRRAVHFDTEQVAIFNLGATEEITILALAELIHNLCDTGKPIRLKLVPYSSFGKYEDVMRRVPDITRARQLLGFEPQVNLREGLCRTIQWQRTLPGS